jgi:MFS family permease
VSVSQRGGVYGTAFRHKDFRWLTLSAVQSRAGDFLYNVALFVVVFDRTHHSAAWVSATAVLIRVPLVVLPPFAGALADRVERRDLMIALDVARAAIMATVAVCVVIHAPIGLIVALAVLTACLATPYSPAAVGLLPALLPEDDLAAANAVSHSLESLALVIGPAIGGALLLVGSPATAFAINAGTFTASALCLLVVHRGPKPHTSADDETDDGLLAGFRAMRSDASVLVIASGLITTCFAVGCSGVLFVLLSDQRLGTGANGYGYLLASVGVGGIVGSLASDRLASVRRMALLVVVALLVVAVSMGSLGGVHIPAAAYALTAVFGAGYILLEVLAVTLMQRVLPPSVLGKASGALDALSFGAVLLGAAIVAPVDKAFGLTTAVLVAAAPAVVAAALTAIAASRLDAQSAADVALLAPRIALLERLDVLRGASRPAIERLAAVADEEHVQAGTSIVTKGQPADDFYVIVDGAAEVRSAIREGAGKELRNLGPGECFGEIGLLRQRPRTATVRATADTRVLRVPGDAFLDVVTTAPALADSFGAMVTARLKHSREEERRR